MERGNLAGNLALSNFGIIVKIGFLFVKASVLGAISQGILHITEDFLILWRNLSINLFWRVLKVPMMTPQSGGG
jgi:hypothetical protein